MSDLEPKPQAPSRLVSLDVLRGATIALMVWVNHTFDPKLFNDTSLEGLHKQWFHVPFNDPLQGATAADLVFPLFLFAAGASVPLSLRFGRGRDRPAWRTMLSALRRGTIIYLLGVLLTVAGSAHTRPLVWADLLSWNILQLIGAAYVVCVALFLLPRWAQVTGVSVTLLVKWGLMTLVPYDTVAELGAAGAAAESVGGVGTWQHFHGVKGWLNSGLGWFGGFQQALPAAGIAMAGGWASLFLAGGGSTGRKLGGLLAIGVLLVALSQAMSWGYGPAGGGLLSRLTVPASKWFFSVPYCLLSAGVGLICLATLWFICDAKRLTSLDFLRVFGLNAIVLYVGSELVFKTIISRWSIHTPTGDTANLASGFIAWVAYGSSSSIVGGLAWPVLWLTLWWLLLLWMHRRKLYIRI